MRRHNLKAGKQILVAAGLLFLAAWPLFSAVKQVRVTAERASIYIEPSRTSSRIDIVGKGMLLNLLQERKVKDMWYYISFNSPRYGTRISGFIQESAVELVAEGPPAVPKAEETAPPKIEREPARPAETAPPPKAEEKKEARAEAPPVTEAKPAPETPAVTKEAAVVTRLPKAKSYKFPRKEASLLEAIWKVEEIAAAPVEKPPAGAIELAELTVPPKRREIALPKKEMPRDDPAWQIVRTSSAETPKTKESPEPERVSPETKKKPAEPKSKPKPAVPQPIKAPPLRPARKGPGLFTVGLGYGSSFGGAGGCLQLNTGMGLSLHAGVGLYPTSLIYSETDWVKNKPLWSIGLKYYLPFKSASFAPFVDIQYGGLRVEAAQVVIGIWDYDYILSQEQKSLWGPSGLAGFEYRIGRLGISAALGASYATTSWDYLETKVSLVFDMGLVFHF